MSIDLRYADKRTAERYLRNGKLDEKEYEKYLKSLPDVADKGAPVEVVMDEFFDDPVEDPDGSGT